MEWTDALSGFAGIPREPFLAWLDGKFVLFWPFLHSTLLLAISVCITSEHLTLKLRALADHLQHGKPGVST